MNGELVTFGELMIVDRHILEMLFMTKELLMGIGMYDKVGKRLRGEKLS